MKILVVDDDLELLGLIAFALRQAGYLVIESADGGAALADFAREQPDLVILDVNLPTLSGFEVCRRIRAEAATPIMMLTVRNSEEDQVHGLDGGADDYLTKPFRVEELLARLRALIRRASRQVAAELRAGSVVVDPTQARVTVDGAPVKLTALEYRVLAYLMHHRGRVVPQAELVEHIYARDEDRDSNTVEVFVARLRRKLGAEAIETVRGLGYRVGGAP